ncbi:hypothetical protein ABZS94_34555 [Streptomyces sp. NPDC005500]|uniref:hypothetical protein n=1 Tax=Streptomyces sp. NPDC005500 TaxID=3155007 RepID=UPI0033B8324A
MQKVRQQRVIAMSSPALQLPLANTKPEGRVQQTRREGRLLSRVPPTRTSGEDLKMLGSQPVDLSGAVKDQIWASGGEDTHVDGDLVARPEQPAPDRYQTPSAIRRTDSKRLETWLKNRKVKGAVVLARTAVETEQANTRRCRARSWPLPWWSGSRRGVMALEEEIAELDTLVENRFHENRLRAQLTDIFPGRERTLESLSEGVNTCGCRHPSPYDVVVYSAIDWLNPAPAPDKVCTRASKHTGSLTWIDAVSHNRRSGASAYVHRRSS